MATNITCPNCAQQFEASEALEASINEKYKASYNQKWTEQKSRLEAQLAKEREGVEAERKKLAAAAEAHDQEIKRQVDEQCRKKEAELKTTLEQKLSGDYEARLKQLAESNESRDQQLKDARKRELEFLKKEESLLRKAEELELEKQRAIRDERSRIAGEMKQQNEAREKERDQAFLLEKKQWELKFEQQQKALKEAQQKAEQGSMQVQGEVQELYIEELLRQAYRHDVVKEIKKGAFGADCHITIRNKYMQDCGVILLESKNTKAFSADWITKLKSDMLACNADVSIIVTQAMPKDMDGFGNRDGVFVCSLAEVKHLIGVLREGIMKVHEARKSQENKGDKMVMLYDYLTGSEFMGQWNAMRESFQAFRTTLQKERDDFEKSWKKKEKLLNTIIQNSMQISGSIEGISGIDSMNWSTLPEEKGYLLD